MRWCSLPPRCCGCVAAAKACRSWLCHNAAYSLMIEPKQLSVVLLPLHITCTAAGRAKDTLVLMSGKNIEPQPIEDALCRSPYIK